MTSISVWRGGGGRINLPDVGANFDPGPDRDKDHSYRDVLHNLFAETFVSCKKLNSFVYFAEG